MKLQALRKYLNKSIIIILAVLLLCVFTIPEGGYATTYTDTKGTITSDSGVNVRKDAGTTYDIVMALAKGTVVTVLSDKKGSDGYKWYKIKYDGKTGYVRSDLMKLNKSDSGDSGDSGNSGSTTPDYTDTVGTITSEMGVNVRKGAGTSYDIVMSLARGTLVDVTGEKKDSEGALWYKIKYDGKTGYVRSDLMEIGEVNIEDDSDPVPPAETMTDSEFNAYIKAQGFPKTYRTLLKALHKEHPTWVFKAAITGLDWNTVINKESVPGRSVVPASYPKYYKSTESGCYYSKTGKYISFDSGGWNQASKVTIRYYMDPRNFLDSSGIYQFLTHAFDGSTQTKAGLKKLVSGTFLANKYPKSSGETSSYSTYVDAIYAAGKAKGVNPYVIASIILTEQGNQGQGGCISGTVKGYEGYYNFFNIGAYRTATMSAVTRGVWYASQSGSYGRPWNTRYKSIAGGAQFYHREYIQTRKNNLYFKKWNVMNGLSNVAQGQYMSNVLGAQLEAYQLKKGYNGMENTAMTFVIPVYENMPAEACPKPEEGSPTNDKEEAAMVEDAEAAIAKKNAKTEKKVAKIVITGKTKRVISKGKRAIKVTWTCENNSCGLDYFQIYRSLKKTKGYTKFFTTSSGTASSYINRKKVEKGTRYYFKIRGAKILKDYYGNETVVYTPWSNIMNRLG